MPPIAEWILLVDRIAPNEFGGFTFFGVHNHVASDEFPFILEDLKFAISLVGEPSEEIRFTVHVYLLHQEIARTGELVVQLNRLGQRIRSFAIDRVRIDAPAIYSLLLNSGDTVLAHCQFTVVDAAKMAEV